MTSRREQKKVAEFVERNNYSQERRRECDIQGHTTPVYLGPDKTNTEARVFCPDCLRHYRRELTPEERAEIMCMYYKTLKFVFPQLPITIY